MGHGASLNVESLIDTRLLIQANSGGGKSWAIRRLLEQTYGMVEHHVLDLEGEFHTLAAKYDYILCGKGQHVEADVKSAGILATKLLEYRSSAIIDLYELEPYQRIKFVRLYLESLMNARKELWHPVMVIIDEAHQFCPQDGQCESGAAVISLCTRGRKRGFMAGLATQRLAKLHKDAAAECSNKMIGRCTLDADQKRAGDELGIGKEERIKLRDLDPGQFIAYGPAFDFKGVKQFTVGAVVTEHPKVGSRQLQTPPPPRKAIQSIVASLKDIPHEAEREAQTVETLKRDNADLRRRLTLAEKAKPAPERIEVQKPCNHEPIIKELQSYRKKLEAKIAAAGKALDVEVAAPTSAIVPHVQSPQRINAVIKSFEKPKANGADSIAIDLNRPQQKIIDAIAWLEAVGISNPKRASVAAVAGYSPTSGGVSELIGRLVGIGYVEIPHSGLVALTDSGRSSANHPNDTPTLDAYHNQWRSILSNPQRRMFDGIIANPEGISRRELAELVGYKPTSGGVSEIIGELVSLGCATLPRSGYVAPSPIMFPVGLL